MEGKHELDPSDFFTYFYDDEFHEIAGKFCGIPEVKIQNFIRGNSNYSILKAYENVIKNTNQNGWKKNLMMSSR